MKRQEWLLVTAILGACEGQMGRNAPVAGADGGFAADARSGADAARTPTDAFRPAQDASLPPGPATVGTCEALPAPMTWQRVSPIGTEKESKSVALDPFNAGTVWAANEHGLHRSDDCGASWMLVSTGTLGDRFSNDASLWSIAIDPVDRGTIYLVGGYGPLSAYKSTNGGVDWVDLFPADSEYAQVQEYRFVNNISIDPYDHRHLLITTHGDCRVYGGGCYGESLDGGETWRLGASPTGWAEGGGVMLLNDRTWLWNDPFGGIWRTEDNGATNTRALEGYGGNGEFTNGPIIPASDGAYYLSSIGGVLRSDDQGRTWERVGTSRTVGLALSSTTIYAADQWSNHFLYARIASPTEWTDLPPVPGARGEQGAPFLAYDEAHHVLYASMWPDGLWRMVVE
jgi:photosystem II stability/assembly factor-like uncharacterized protein